MKFPILGQINFRIFWGVYYILVSAQKVIIILTEDIGTVSDVETPFRSVEVSDEPENRSCD